MLHGTRDWTGDGENDWHDFAFELGMIRNITDELDREDRISRMTQAVRDYGEETVDGETFRELCCKLQISFSDFTQDDLNEINRRLQNM